jgi:hypothetical protein
MRNVAQASACQGALRACATGPIQPLNECGASFSACSPSASIGRGCREW